MSQTGGRASSIKRTGSRVRSLGKFAFIMLLLVGPVLIQANLMLPNLQGQGQSRLGCMDLSTGTGGDGVADAPGTKDTLWQVTSYPPLTTATYGAFTFTFTNWLTSTIGPYSVSPVTFAWVGAGSVPDPNNWVGVSANWIFPYLGKSGVPDLVPGDQWPTALDAPAGNYTYSTTIVVPNTWTSGGTLTIEGYTSDNAATVKLDTTTTLDTSPGAFNAWRPQVISPVAVGPHTLSVIVNNLADTEPKTGLLVKAKICPAPTTNPCAAISSADILAWWKMDESPSAPLITDSSGQNYNAIPKDANGGTTTIYLSPGPPPAGPVPVTSPPLSTIGKVGSALYFYGPYAEASSGLNFGPSSFTIDGWVWPVQVSGTFVSPILDKRDGGGNPVYGYTFYLQGGTLNLVINNVHFVTTVPTIPFGTWTHVAVTIDRGTSVGTFYINGSPASTGTGLTFPASPSPSLITNALPLWIGKSRMTGVGFGEIGIDDLEIWNRTLTQNEIQTIYSAGSAGKCPTTRLCPNGIDLSTGTNGLPNADPVGTPEAAGRWSIVTAPSSVPLGPAVSVAPHPLYATAPYVAPGGGPPGRINWISYQNPLDPNAPAGLYRYRINFMVPPMWLSGGTLFIYGFTADNSVTLTLKDGSNTPIASWSSPGTPPSQPTDFQNWHPSTPPVVFPSLPAGLPPGSYALEADVNNAVPVGPNYTGLAVYAVLCPCVAAVTKTTSLTRPGSTVTNTTTVIVEGTTITSTRTAILPGSTNTSLATITTSVITATNSTTRVIETVVTTTVTTAMAGAVTSYTTTYVTATTTTIYSTYTYDGVTTTSTATYVSPGSTTTIILVYSSGGSTVTSTTTKTLPGSTVTSLSTATTDCIAATTTVPPTTTTATSRTATPACVIATAAYGSDLAAAVQFLRSFRDTDVMSTYVGSRFMSAFNAWYYSWAPTIAQQIAPNENYKAAIRVLISPLIGSLFVGHMVFEALAPTSPELAILSAGLLASAILGLTYLTPAYALAWKLSKRRITKRTIYSLAACAAALTFLATLSTGTFNAAANLTALAVVETLLLTPALILRKITSLIKNNTAA